MAEAEDVVGFHVFRMQRYNKFFIPARGGKGDGITELPCRQRIDGISPWSRRNLAEKPMESRQDADEISPRSRWSLAENPVHIAGASTRLSVSTKPETGVILH